MESADFTYFIQQQGPMCLVHGEALLEIGLNADHSTGSRQNSCGGFFCIIEIRRRADLLQRLCVLQERVDKLFQVIDPGLRVVVRVWAHLRLARDVATSCDVSAIDTVATCWQSTVASESGLLAR